jgi:hypothetical protein
MMEIRSNGAFFAKGWATRPPQIRVGGHTTSKIQPTVHLIVIELACAAERHQLSDSEFLNDDSLGTGCFNFVLSFREMIKGDTDVQVMSSMFINVVKDCVEWNRELDMNRVLQLRFIFRPFLAVAKPRDFWMRVMQEDRESHQAVPYHERDDLHRQELGGNAAGR